jgi:hypothetical protein
MTSKICPGFHLVTHSPSETKYRPPGFYPGEHYDEVTYRPFTKICTHEKCQYDAEYMYAMVMNIAVGDIDNFDYIFAVPKPFVKDFVYFNSDNLPNYCSEPKEGCSGFVIYKNDNMQNAQGWGYVQSEVDYVPYTCDAYTKPCTHEDCDPTVIARWTYIHLIGKGVLDDETFKNIEENGWKQRFLEGQKKGLDLAKIMLQGNTVEDDENCLWIPTSADNWATHKTAIPMLETLFQKLNI